MNAREKYVWVNKKMHRKLRLVLCLYYVISFGVHPWADRTTQGFNTLRPRRICRHFADDILKCIFWKIYVFWLKFHWSLFLRVQLTIFQNWFRRWLDAHRATSHCLNQWWLDHRRIYASLSLNELTRDTDLKTGGSCVKLVTSSKKPVYHIYFWST